MRYRTTYSSLVPIRIFTDPKGKAEGREASLAHEHHVTVVAVSTARSLKPVKQP